MMLERQCPVCASLLDEEDLFCANCGHEAPPAEDEASRAAVNRPIVFKNRFTCQECGAAMSYDASAQALRCPFCGSTELKAQADGISLAPRYVVPFLITQAQAITILHQRMRAGFFHPSDLTQRSVIMELTPVYVPFWIFSANTQTYWTADSSNVPLHARGEWRPVFGEHRNRHEGLKLVASKILSWEEAAGLGDYDLSQGIPPEQVDLDNIIVEQFSMPRKYARTHARQLIEDAEMAHCEKSLTGGRIRNLRVNVKIERMRGEPVLLPVWILAYRYRDQVYRFLVNGQTGRSYGAFPTSPWKVLLVILILVAVIVLFLIIVVKAVA
ncbi:MAG: hypothetical protein ACUVQG_15095 [Thermogutta sp.]